MDNQNDLSENETLNVDNSSASQADLPITEKPSAPADQSDLSAEPIPSKKEPDGYFMPPEEKNEAEEPKKERGYSGKTLFFALFFFVLTVGCFLFYALAGGTFLYNLLVTLKEKSVDKTVAGIFGTILALPFMIIFGIAQFPTNIISTILLKRVAGKANARWKNVLFGIFYGISIFTFVALFLLAGGVVAATILG